MIGKEKIWTLAYADDLVLIAKRPEELKEMIGRFRNYLAKKKLIPQAHKKTKVLCPRD